MVGVHKHISELATCPLVWPTHAFRSLDDIAMAVADRMLASGAGQQLLMEDHAQDNAPLSPIVRRVDTEQRKRGASVLVREYHFGMFFESSAAYMPWCKLRKYVSRNSARGMAL